jgi:23S rRNA (uridine2552-2'-O)-methyltransferase
MKKNKTSRAWVHDHVNDPWVQRAQAEGYRARAAFKLLEIDERDHLLRPGAVVVDLGSGARLVVPGCGQALRPEGAHLRARPAAHGAGGGGGFPAR